MITKRLDEDLKTAMRQRDAVKVRTIRSIRAAITEKEIEMRPSGVTELSDDDVLGLLQKQAKQRRDSIEQFEAAGRSDLAETEEEELAVIEEYLPKQMSDEEVREVLLEVIEATQATSMADMGKVMGEAMNRIRGRADGKRISSLARELLSSRK